MEYEFRVYHDDAGKILFYTMEKPAGQYIVISRMEYISSRMDAVVRDGRLQSLQSRSNKPRYVKNNDGEIKTSKYDINILVSDAEIGHYWEYTNE